MTEEGLSSASAQVPDTLPAVALVGFMGAGKTTVGELLAVRIGWRFVDLDRVIEAREGRSVPEIFAKDGEARFRQLEDLALSEILSNLRSERLVIALGGGAFMNPGIRSRLEASGVTAVWLHADAAELYRRCEHPATERPLRRSEQEFRLLYESRTPTYSRAQIRIDTKSKEVDAVVDEIIAALSASNLDRSSQ